MILDQEGVTSTLAKWWCLRASSNTGVRPAPNALPLTDLVVSIADRCEYSCLFLCHCSSQLTWRDVQHLLVKTSRPAHLKANDWKVNGAGHKGAAETRGLGRARCHLGRACG